jgi:rhamnosyltransferase
MSKSLTSNKEFISVFIPTYNGQKYIKECIDMIIAQELPVGYELEIIVIDSGSNDNTVPLLRDYGDRIVLKTIPNSEFGHGKTRAYASRIANGKFILFLTQDATPQNTRWIVNMIEPFFVSDQIGCVFGRQVPRPFAVPTIKREVATVFAGLGALDSIVLHRHRSLVDNEQTNILNTFFSDVNSAIRKDLVSDIPFRDVAYAEDQALAEDMQNKGYLKAYSPQGAVWHSNEYTAKEYYRRKFDEYIGLQDSIKMELKPQMRPLLLGWVKPTLHDIKFTLRDSEYNKRAKFKFIFGCIFYNIAEKVGRHKAAKYYENLEVRNKISLEAKNKS